MPRTKTPRKRSRQQAPTVPNPSAPRKLKPVHLITDRAKRYRAQASLNGAIGSTGATDKLCHYCGATPRRIDVEHIDGNEANNEPENLIHACRSCNTAKGLLFKRHRIGRRTAQYNPEKKHGARSFSQWVWAAQTVTGKRAATAEEIRQAASLIAHTPPSTKKRYGRQVWSTRRAHGTDTIEKVPF